MNRYWLLLLSLVGMALIAGVLLTNARSNAKAERGSGNRVVDLGRGESLPAPTGEEATLLNEAYSLAQERDLPFAEAPRFQRVTREHIREVWEERGDSLFPGEVFENMGLAYSLLGFIEPAMEWRGLFLAGAAPSPDCVYDSHEEVILLSEEWSLADPEHKEFFHQQLMLQLIDQQFGLRELSLYAEVQADESQARHAVVWGDAAYHAAKRNRDGSIEPMARLKEYYARLPELVRDWFMLPYEEGAEFCKSVSEAGIALDSIYQQMPTTTSHLLHPERYLRQPRFQPRQVRWAQLDIRNGVEPLWDNVAGELLIRGLLRKTAAREDADLIAAGWDGDRSVLYIDEGPHLAWKTLWQSEDAAYLFFLALKASVKTLYGVSDEKRITDSESLIHYDYPFSLIIRHEGDSVVLLRSTSPEWQEALDQLITDAEISRR